jgi:hypothetical protein
LWLRGMPLHKTHICMIEVFRGPLAILICSIYLLLHPTRNFMLDSLLLIIIILLTFNYCYPNKLAIMQLTTLLSLAFALPILANDLYPRAAYAGGGFGLVSSNCPAGTKSFICGSCCPIGFAIQNTCGTSPEGTACCPDGKSYLQ